MSLKVVLQAPRRINPNTYLYNLYIYWLFVKLSKTNSAGCQADVTTTPLASFALVMAAAAVETSAATHFPPEISITCLFSLIRVEVEFSGQGYISRMFFWAGVA